MVILVFLVRHSICIEPCGTKCPARSELSAGHQQKSAGHVRHVRHISLSLTSSGKRLISQWSEQYMEGISMSIRDVSEFYLFRHLTSKRAELARLGGGLGGTTLK